MTHRLLRIFALLTIWVMLLGVTSQAALFTDACPPGKCCCDPSPDLLHPMKHPAARHPGTTSLYKGCNTKQSCCHLKTGQSSRKTVDPALPTHSVHAPSAIVVSVCYLPVQSDQQRNQLWLSRERAASATGPPIYIRTVSILC